MLAQRFTTLETALSTGLSGTGRLHDLFLTWEAMTPGDLRQIVTAPGPVRPLAQVAAAVALSVGAIVCASIA